MILIRYVSQADINDSNVNIHHSELTGLSVPLLALTKNSNFDEIIHPISLLWEIWFGELFRIY